MVSAYTYISENNLRTGVSAYCYLPAFRQGNCIDGYSSLADLLIKITAFENGVWWF